MKADSKRELAAQLISDVPEKKRDGFLAAVYMTIKSVKNTFPDLSDEDQGKICECVARVVSGFNIVPVSELNNILTSMFTAYMVASAQLEGVIEENATPEHVKEIVENALKRFDPDETPEETAEDNEEQPVPNTGMYL